VVTFVKRSETSLAATSTPHRHVNCFLPKARWTAAPAASWSLAVTWLNTCSLIGVDEYPICSDTTRIGTDPSSLIVMSAW
jgi:hypothetical protein